MKFNKQAIVRALCAQTLICSILSLIFSQKKKGLSSVFAGLSIAGAVANLALSCVTVRITPDDDDCCCDDCEDECDDECLDEGDIYCDFEEVGDAALEADAE